MNEEELLQILATASRAEAGIAIRTDAPDRFISHARRLMKEYGISLSISKTLDEGELWLTRKR